MHIRDERVREQGYVEISDARGCLGYMLLLSEIPFGTHDKMHKIECQF